MPDADALLSGAASRGGGPVTRALRSTGRRLLALPAPLAAALVGAWAALIWWLSGHASPVAVQPSPLWEWLSNLAHAPLFGLLTMFTAALVLRDRTRAWPRVGSARGMLVLASTLVYGVVDEWHQSRVEGRDASALDVLTDVVAGALVLWIVGVLGRGALTERGLLARLAAGLGVCAACAALAMAS
jgi:VanZ family protein